MTSLESLGEDALVHLLTSYAPQSEDLIEGPGDDCAIVRRDASWDTLLKTDAVVEGIHFLPDTHPPLIGRKALARSISDIAAMGGIPEHALVTILVHPSRSAEFLCDIYEGLTSLAREYRISLAGGETGALPYDGIVLNVALVGRVEHGCALRRCTASPGDLIAVTGALGNSFHSERHLTFTPRVEWARELITRGLRPSAAMDLSDGLGTDLPRLARASGCGFEIDPNALPLHEGCNVHNALCDGEDYELLLTFPASTLSHCPIGSCVSGLDFPLTVIGKMNDKGIENLPMGWVHFSR